MEGKELKIKKKYVWDVEKLKRLALIVKKNEDEARRKDREEMMEFRQRECRCECRD